MHVLLTKNSETLLKKKKRMKEIKTTFSNTISCPKTAHVFFFASFLLGGKAHQAQQ